MHIECETHELCTLARAIGRISCSDVATLDATPCLNDIKQNIVFDLGGVESIDSTGFGVIFGIVRRFQQAKRKFIIVNPRPQANQALYLMSLDRLVPIMDSVDLAMGAMAE